MGVVAAVHDEHGIAVEDLKTGGPAGVGQALTNSIVGNGPALAPQNLHCGQHHSGVVKLIGPHQGDAQILPGPVGEGLPLQAEVAGDELAVIRPGEGAVLLCRHPLKDSLGLRILAVDHHIAVGLDDAGLGGGNLRHSAAQLPGVVEAHGGDHGHLRRVDHIGGVQGAPHANLQHHNIAVLALEKLHGDGGDEFKLRGGVGHAVGVGAHIVRELCQLLVTDAGVVHLHALVETVDEGGGVQAHGVARLLQDGGEHGGGGPLAVGAGNVDEFQGLLRVAQLTQQLPGAAEAGDAPLPADAVDIGQGFAVVHDDYLISFLNYSISHAYAWRCDTMREITGR